MFNHLQYSRAGAPCPCEEAAHNKSPCCGPLVE